MLFSWGPFGGQLSALLKRFLNSYPPDPPVPRPGKSEPQQPRAHRPPDGGPPAGKPWRRLQETSSSPVGVQSETAPAFVLTNCPWRACVKIRPQNGRGGGAGADGVGLWASVWLLKGGLRDETGCRTTQQTHRPHRPQQPKKETLFDTSPRSGEGPSPHPPRGWPC